MPIHFKYNSKNDALYGAMEGQVTTEELRQAMDEITESDEFPADVRTLWDIRKLDFTTIDSSFGSELISIRRLNPKRDNTKIAIIADKDHSFGMSRMYEKLSDDLPQHIMVFRGYTSGENWLLGV